MTNLSSTIPVDLGLPEPSRAVRTVPSSSKRSVVGELVIGPGRGRVVQFASRLEMKTILLLSGTPGVRDIVEQPEAVEYVDASGIRRKHTFDILVTMDDGTKTACAVRPRQRAERKGFAEELALIAAQMPSAFAQKVCLVTEDNLDPVQVHNSEMINAMRHVDAEADAAAERAVSCMQGAVTLEDLAQLIGLQGRGMRALVRLIGARRLVLLKHEKISLLTLVQTPEAQS